MLLSSGLEMNLEVNTRVNSLLVYGADVMLPCDAMCFHGAGRAEMRGMSCQSEQPLSTGEWYFTIILRIFKEFK